ncbi:MAG: DUF885 domain-containing protein [Bryobacterales bacterium]|nr:DUF885 domain-containing protein [Bryobacterales bacterium]
MRTSAAVTLFALALTGCSRTPSMPFTQLVDQKVYDILALSPIASTQYGYHRHNGRKLDEMLDDYSPAGIELQRNFFQDLGNRLRGYRPEQLPPESRIDHRILTDLASLNLLELNSIQNFRHNPTVYVEQIGSALFPPFVLDYAPAAERYRAIVARMKQIPAFLDTARANLVDSPEIWTKVAVLENQGNIDLIDKTLRQAAPPQVRAEYEAAAPAALEALKNFTGWLNADLAKRAGDWRLGREKYAQKFALVMQSDTTPEKVLEQAEADLKKIRRQMFDLALPLHHQMYPSHRDPVDLNLIVGEVLNRIAQRHAKPDQYLETARRDLAEATAFVQSRGLVPPAGHDNLRVIETPEFMRGLYGVGGFNPAPVLEPQLGAFYWITPIPRDWPGNRVESKLREYNYYGLKLLTIHEAMPGHYVQFEYSNQIQPTSRRVLRAIAGNGAYVEGWAVYATRMMLDEGYLDNSPELRLTFLKQQLRMIANAILDVRLQTMGMTDQQAMDLMLRDTFQEKEEATAKLQRAKLSSTQLPTYLVGFYGWLAVRDACQRAAGAGFQLADFHRRALNEGAIPLAELKMILAP